MKKFYFVLFFIISAISAFFITKYINESREPKLDVDTTKVVGNSSDTLQDSDTLPTNISDTVSLDNNKGVITEKSQNPSNPSIKPVNPGNLVKNDTIPVKPQKHVNISPNEIKNLIKTGRYTSDRRISKNYSIEYVDVSDDDMGELQQNFTFVQERVEFETWRDFEVVGIDYDEKNGLVNCVKIRPIY